MYAKAYYMPGKIEYCGGRKKRSLWILPVVLGILISVGVLFISLGYHGVIPARVDGEEYMEVVSDDVAEPVPELVQDTIEALPEEPMEPIQEPAPEPEPVPVIGEPTPSPTAEPTKTMYLTFDDGPSAEYTDTILDVLAKYDIKATFFLVGENVEKRPEVAKRIAEEGHTIGIHCYSHAYDDIYGSVEEYVADFEKAYDIIYETTGVEVKIFRFPGGSINGYNKHVYKDIIAEMTERGFTYYDWNASLEDAVKRTSPEQLVKNAIDTTMGRERVIMLAHDTIYNTSLCIEDIILQFPEYKMEPITEDVVPIRFRD